MMRSHQMLTDVILEVGSELFYAHRVVLAAASPYFKAMFTGGLRESEMNRVKLQGISPTAVGKLIFLCILVGYELRKILFVNYCQRPQCFK